MPTSAGHGGRNSEPGGYKPGGASGHGLLGILSRSEKRKVAEISERKCIARRHDASSIALNADPGALVIDSPLQSRRSSAPCFFRFVSSFRCPVTSYQNQTLRIAPRSFDRRCRLAAQQPSDADPNEPETHLFDETFGGEECAAENCEPANNTSRMGPCNTFSCCRGGARCRKFQTRCRDVHPPHGKRLNFRTFGRRESRRTTAAWCPKKNLGPRHAKVRIGVGAAAIRIRYCHMCGFCARFLYVAFHLPAWLKGFCAVADLLQRRHRQRLSRFNRLRVGRCVRSERNAR